MAKHPNLRTVTTRDRTALKEDGHRMTRFQLVVSLAGRILQSGQMYLNSALREKQLGSAEANILMFLYTHGDGVRQEDIVAGVDVSKPAVSRTIMSLVKKGYVKRVHNQDDKRSYTILLTEKARKEEAFIQKHYEDLVVAASSGIPEAKIEEFVEIFRRVADNLDAYRKSKFGR